MTDTTTRRQRLADAAITTLARSGMRGLTHRAVDQAAGLPEGSCSYYFRTRQALLQATVERLVEVDTADLTARPVLVGEGGDPATIAEAAAEIVQHWTTLGSERMLARYELLLEASRRPELRAVLTKARDHYRVLAQKTLAAAGTADPAAQAQLFVACVDGLVFRHLTDAGRLTIAPDELRRAFLDLLQGFSRPGD